MVRGVAMAVTAVAGTYQWAETASTARGRGRAAPSARRAPPFLLRLGSAWRRRRCHFLLDRVRDRVRVAVVRHHHRELIPQPLAGGREVEVVTCGGEAVGEGHAPAGGAAGVGPVTGFQQYGAKHTELDHLAAHTVDLDPVADPHAVPAHQHEPADEGDDEVLERHCEARAGETEHGAQLPGYSYHYQEDDHHADDLQRDACHIAQRGELAAVDTRPLEQPFQPA